MCNALIKTSLAPLSIIWIYDIYFSNLIQLRRNSFALFMSLDDSIRWIESHKNWPPFLYKTVIAAAKLSVHGKPDPTPSGAMAIKNKIPPIHPNLNIQLLRNIKIAIKPWQVATTPITNEMCLLNHTWFSKPLIIWSFFFSFLFSTFLVFPCKHSSSYVQYARKYVDPKLRFSACGEIDAIPY